jgi:hypothetical protein
MRTENRENKQTKNLIKIKKKEKRSIGEGG